jgi:hypothetical protein
MSKVVGRLDSLLLVSNSAHAVVIDTDFNMVIESGLADALKGSRKWEASTEELSTDLQVLTERALKIYEPEVIIASGARLYTIPKAAQAEAKRALEWHKEHKRGGTPVGMNTARTLAKGGQIGVEKIRHIAKYFPRHEVDKKGKGWDRGSEQYPSNGRIAWALWGGEAAKNWAADIVETENNKKKALKAAGFDELKSVFYGDQNPLDSFKDAYLNDDIAMGPEFIARVRLDGSGIDRLYKVDVDGQVYVWDDGVWEDLASSESDVWTYDKALDDPYDLVEKSHIQIDPESAIIIAARLEQSPSKHVSIFDIDAEEASLMSANFSAIDWSLVDNVITAAGENFGKTAPTPATDGNYTPEERSQKASAQARDAFGKFIPSNGRVVIGGNPNAQGNVTKTNTDGTVTVKLDNGNEVNIDPKLVQNVNTNGGQDQSFRPTAKQLNFDSPLDTSGILGEPRTPIDEPKARLSGTLPPMTKNDLHDVLFGWDSWVQKQRDSFKPTSTAEVIKYGKQKYPNKPIRSSAEELAETTEEEFAAEEHDLIKELRKKKAQVDQTSEDEAWAKPVVAAAPTDAPAKELTPDTSDVKPLYMAIVAGDDPRAVLDLVSLVPASSTSSKPMTYKRLDQKWVRDESVLNDMKSATPPPVVALDSETLQDVLKQVDGLLAAAFIRDDKAFMVLWGPNPEVMAVVAAGGADRSRGNAEKLRRYWVSGPGAAKIRWGAGGDWKRCVRHLSKYLGVRAKGYCQLRHKEALGIYTSTHAKKLGGPHRGRNNSIETQGEFIMEEVLTKNYGTPTEVTDKDMLMPIEAIHAENDDLYEHDWTPEPEIENLLNDESCRKEMSNFSIEEHSTEDPCWDGYKQIGFKDKNGKHVPNCVKAGGAVTAAGAMDRNRGNAEDLRQYWTTGKGGLKIRWGVTGDWTRCVRSLSKYLGPRAKGYCALRHKEMTGMWTGDKRHRQLAGRKAGNNKAVFSNEFINATNHVIELVARDARIQDAKNRVLGLTASAQSDVAGTELVGADASFTKFSIPLLIPEGMESGDGRKFRKGAITMRELPVPLMWQIKTNDGHLGSVVVGRIDHMERVADGIGNATGVFDNGIYGKEAERLVRNGFIRGVSADMDQFEAEEAKETYAEDGKEVKKDKLIINKARVMAATIVPKPAFQECKIFLVDEEKNPQEENVIPDGVYAEDVDPADAAAIVACGYVAGAIPLTPPTEWFDNPKLSKATPLTVTDDGKVFGHIAAWNVDHIGMAGGTKPPRSKSKYAYFHTGVVRTVDGIDVPVGQLTLAGGHAPLHASAQQAAKHYDDTASAFADVHAGEDSFGIWVSGSLRPGISPEQVRAVRASAPSGDWRPIKGSLELVAVCQVNVPGFPIARAMVASGQVMALVAAGAQVLAKMKSDPINELTERLARLESFTTSELNTRAQSAKALFAEVKAQKNSALSARAAELSLKLDSVFSYEDGFTITRRERNSLVQEGKAMKDGSFPIRNADDLKNAVHSYGRTNESKRASVRNWIIKRARQLKRPDLVPQEWKDSANAEFSAKVEAMRSKASEFSTIVAAPVEMQPILDENGEPMLDESGNPVMGQPTPAPVAPETVTPKGDVSGKADAVEPVNPEDAPVGPTITPDGEVLDAAKYISGKTQPRDDAGKFRKVLARLKQDLGTAGLQKIAEEAKTIEGLHEVGNYAEAAKAADQLIDIVDRLDSGALNKVSLENVRTSAAELGKVIANLPLGFNDQAQKVRYSDLPPALQGLMDDMISRVEDKIGKKDAAIATEQLKSFKSGSDVYSQAEISSQMSKLLRLLT